MIIQSLAAAGGGGWLKPAGASQKDPQTYVFLGMWAEKCGDVRMCECNEGTAWERRIESRNSPIPPQRNEGRRLKKIFLTEVSSKQSNQCFACFFQSWFHEEGFFLGQSWHR